MDAEGVGRRLDLPYPDEAAIERIVGIPDLLERNAAITRGYHALSEAVAAVLGRDQANWLTFGQWASAEARRSISAEAIPAPLRGLMSEGVAAAVAEGNAVIFGDVAPPFIRFVRAFAPIAGAPAVRSRTVRPAARDAVRLTRPPTRPRAAPRGHGCSPARTRGQHAHRPPQEGSVSSRRIRLLMRPLDS